MNARRVVTAVLYALCGVHVSSQLVPRDEVSRQGLMLSSCPVVQFFPEERVVGRSLRVSVKITNIGTQNFDHTTVKLDFPADALAVEKASVFPPMKGDDRALVESSFYWLNINIAAGKTRKFTLWAQTQDCKYSPSSRFKASLYLTDAEGTPRCFMSSESFGKKSNTCAPTPAPTVNPNVPYSVYAVGEKCSEGTAIEPASQNQNIRTPDKCWEYCSFNGSSPLPYYFNWNVVTKECYCVGQTCTLVYDTDYTVFRVDQLATRAPTLAPTTRPTSNDTFPPTLSPTTGPTTFSPTTFPTSSPTAAPTTFPTTVPTTFPTSSPTTLPTTFPTSGPTAVPTTFPTSGPTAAPTTFPTTVPTTFPTSFPTAAPTTFPTSGPTTTPTTFPTSRPTTLPTQAPTRACSFGEFRDPVTGECLPCVAGTYWNESTQTTECPECPSGQTSLQGARECYNPCPQFSALNTTDLTCVPVPQNLQDIATQDNVTVNLNTSDIFIVEEPLKFQDTLGRADNSSNLNTTDPGAAIVVVISPGVFPVQDTTVVRLPLVLIADNDLSTRRRLQTAVNPVIVALSGRRHFIVDSTSLIVDGIVFQGAVSAAYSGGLELVGTNPVGQFISTTFRSCSWESNGGAVLLGGSGAQCFVETGCSFLDNSAPEGAGIYAGTGSTLTVSNAVSFTNNSAPQTSSTSGGGGGIFLNNAQLTLGSDVYFDANINDDITSVTSTVSCLNSSYSSSCSGGCTGSYNVPTSCPFCSSPSGSVCNTCSKGTYGGAEAELPCQLCPYGQTTVFPPFSNSSSACVDITQSPTSVPTAAPTRVPSLAPTVVPTRVPSSAPTVVPTRAPSRAPTVLPTLAPSSTPTVPPTRAPTVAPTVVPTSTPTVVPTRAPSSAPTVVPTRPPTVVPTRAPSSSPTTAAPSRRPTQSPTALYPFVRVENVTSLDTSAFPPPDVWSTTQNSFNSIQSISPAPSPYSCSLRQETFNNPSKATAGISWEQSGMFNGMLFRTFVLRGFQLFYNYFVLVTPVGQQNIYAPDIRIQTRSPITGRYADFIWNPYNNRGSQGNVAYQTWKGNNITQTTGSSQFWPSPPGPTGGEGWTCTLNCYLPVNSTDNATNTSRNLLTYVNALLDQDENSQAYVSINSAIITGLQVVLGPEEPNSISFTHDVSVRSGAYNWAWAFNC